MDSPGFVSKRLFFFLIGNAIILNYISGQNGSSNWALLSTQNLPIPRHECAAVGIGNSLFLLGGRRLNPVESLDLKTATWTSLAAPPFELHHFQAITWKKEIWVIGAFTGPYPHEKPVPDIWIFNPKTNKWRQGPIIPEGRRRGSAGAFVYKKKIYLVSGIIDGHWDGHVPWFDVYNPKTAHWEALPDAPRARDHFHAARVGTKLYLIGGRRSSGKMGQVFQQTVPEVDVFDFKTRKWSVLPPKANLPVPTAGCSSVAIGKHIWVIGGESTTQGLAHAECQVFSTKTLQWQQLPKLHTGRHGTQAVFFRNRLLVPAGSAKRGGGPEQTSVEFFIPPSQGIKRNQRKAKAQT